jgi:hypothetical protein
MTPAWILDILAAFMLVVAAVSAARLVARPPWQYSSAGIDTDVAHLLMGIAMAGMFTSSLTTLPNTVWEVIFGLLTAWFLVRVVVDGRASGVRALAGGHCAPHLIHSAAMLYMFLAIKMSGAAMSGGMGGMSGGGSSMTLDHPTIAFVFALILIGYTLWDLDQLSGRRYSVGTARVALAGVGAVPVPAAATVGSGEGALPSSQSADTGARPAADDQVSHGAARGVGGILLLPAVTVGCRIVMGVAMAFMLIIAI